MRKGAEGEGTRKIESHFDHPAVQKEAGMLADRYASIDPKSTSGRAFTDQVGHDVAEGEEKKSFYRLTQQREMDIDPDYFGARLVVGMEKAHVYDTLKVAFRDIPTHKDSNTAATDALPGTMQWIKQLAKEKREEQRRIKRLRSIPPSMQMNKALEGKFPQAPEIKAFTDCGRRIRQDASTQLTFVGKRLLRQSSTEADIAPRVFTVGGSWSPEERTEAYDTGSYQAAEVFAAYERENTERLNRRTLPVVSPEFHTAKVANEFLVDLRKTVERNQGISQEGNAEGFSRSRFGQIALTTATAILSVRDWPQKFTNRDQATPKSK